VSSSGQPHASEQLQLTISPKQGVAKNSPNIIGINNDMRICLFI